MKLSLERSHRHLLRVSINESIVAGELLCNSSSNLFVLVLDPFLYYIPHRQPTHPVHPAETAMVERFQFASVCFFQCMPSFRFPS
jgi:hypothetical protein